MDMTQAMNQINAEKIALDQLFVESLKNNLQTKKENVLLQEEIQKLKTENEQLKKQIESFKSQEEEVEVSVESKL